MKATSGTTAKATTADATDVMPAASTSCARHMTMVSAVASFYSLDNVTTRDRIEANVPQTRYDVFPIAAVKVKRDGATDVTGVYASVWGCSHGHNDDQARRRRFDAPVDAEHRHVALHAC